MLVSYWDGGYVVLDVTNPAAPSFIADSDFASPDPEAAESGLNVAPEGNAHEAEFTLDNQYIVAADEDFNAYKGVATNDDDGTTFTAIQGSGVPGIPQGGSIDGDDRVRRPRLCDADPAVPPAGGPDQIAVVARGVCTFQEKYDNVVAAGGYEALLVVNREDTAVWATDATRSSPCSWMATRCRRSSRSAASASTSSTSSLRTTMRVATPAVRPTCPAFAIGTVGDPVSLESFFDGWGYVHLYKDGGAGKLVELDTYAIPQAHDEDFATGFGDLSVHEAATSLTDPRLVYFSYYAGGFRVARIMQRRSSSRRATSSTRAATTSGASRSSTMKATSTSPPRTAITGSTSSSTPVPSGLTALRGAVLRGRPLSLLRRAGAGGANSSAIVAPRPRSSVDRAAVS